MSLERSKHLQNVPASRDLRAHQTATEIVLWEALRNRRLEGLKFRRQHPVGPFVLDFSCSRCSQGIELDGAVHAAQTENDAERESVLTAAGYRVLRFPNEAVRDNLPAVLAAIRAAAASELPPLTSPLPRTGAW